MLVTERRCVDQLRGPICRSIELLVTARDCTGRTSEYGGMYRELYADCSDDIHDLNTALCESLMECSRSGLQSGASTRHSPGRLGEKGVAR